VSYVTVSGSMVQAGGVFMDGNGVIKPAAERWSFDLPVRLGKHSLVASNDYNRVDAEGRILIRRQQQIDGPTTLDPVDLSIDGVPTVTVPLDITNVDASDAISTEVDLLIDDEYTRLSTTRTNAIHVAPPSVLVPGDRQVLIVSASSGGRTEPVLERVAIAEFTGSETQFALLPQLSGITYANGDVGLVASWESLPVAHPAFRWLVG